MSMGPDPQTLQLGVGQRAGMPSLPRQNSIYSLTLQQFQNTLAEPGKSFGSMNMDEFLKNIWTAEEKQAMAAALGGIHDAAVDGELLRQPSSQLQGSLTLPRTLSAKTVDEVWKDIYKEPVAGLKGGAKADSDEQPKQLTFGEMTLEDFLVKAGVVREDLEPASQSFISYMDGVGNQASNGIATTLAPSPVNVLANNNLVGKMQLDAYESADPTPEEWLNHSYQKPCVAAMSKQQHNLHQEADSSLYLNATRRIGNGTMPAAGIGGMNAGGGLAALGGMGLVKGLPRGVAVGLASGITEGLGPACFGLGADSPASDEIGPHYDNEFSFSPAGNYGTNGGWQGRKRGAEGPIERAADRRQKRMIKNRESAARSRARKQVITMELEGEISQLKEENARLRKLQEEDAEQRKKHMLDMMTSLTKDTNSKTDFLRRTQTGPW